MAILRSQAQTEAMEDAIRSEIQRLQSMNTSVLQSYPLPPTTPAKAPTYVSVGGGSGGGMGTSSTGILGPGYGTSIHSPISTGIYKMGRTIDTDAGRKRMIGDRLQWEEANVIPFDHLNTHLADDKVYVFLVLKGKAMLIEDDAGMFPSDTFITQLRLIL